MIDIDNKMISYGINLIIDHHVIYAWYVDIYDMIYAMDDITKNDDIWIRSMIYDDDMYKKMISSIVLLSYDVMIWYI